MIHLNTELKFVNQEIGFGVFATEFIPKGTITWALDKLDQIIEPEQVANMAPIYKGNIEKYAYIDPLGKYVLCWDLGRYMNHSCNPSTRGIGYNFDLAIRDIYPGDELTCDYGHLNLTSEFECGCKSFNCRGVVKPSDIIHHGQGWDAQYAQAFALINQVEQPLWSIAIDENSNDTVLIEALKNSGATLPSCLDFIPKSRNYYSKQVQEAKV